MAMEENASLALLHLPFYDLHPSKSMAPVDVPPIKFGEKKYDKLIYIMVFKISSDMSLDTVSAQGRNHITMENLLLSPQPVMKDPHEAEEEETGL